MEIKYNFHTHTPRCGHATGVDQNYVDEAINIGLKYLGFSDHIFFPDHRQPGTRGDYKELDGYISSINSLKEQYKDKINIFLGFEAEYFDYYKDYYQELKKKGIQYFILGQHFFMDKYNDLVYFRNSIEDQDIENYYKDIEKGIKSGLFLYFAHPDFYVTMKETFDDQAKDVAYRIARLCKEYDVPLEINLNGMSWTLHNLTYPCPDFWKIVGEVGTKVTIGYDAHQPEFFRETKWINKAKQMVEDYKLNYVGIEELLKKIGQ